MYKAGLLSLATAGALMFYGCQKTEFQRFVDTEFILSEKAVIDTKSSADPDEHLISNINLLIFNEEGLLEYHRYVTSREFESGNRAFKARLLSGARYSAFALVNFNYKVSGITTVDEIFRYRYFLAYPDEYREGMPMTGRLDNFDPANGGKFEIGVERMMAKVSVSIDRSRLSPNVKFDVYRVGVGGCPKSASAFGESAVSGKSDTFPAGYYKSGYDTDRMNIDMGGKVSGEINLFMLENIQGELLKDIGRDKDKILTDNRMLGEKCSYIELWCTYMSDSLHTVPGNYLKYRFYLGESRTDFSVRRNCNYHFVVTPTGSGIEENGWRVDKDGLTAFNSGKIKVHPGNYIEGKVGDEIRIWVELNPPDSKFSFGIEELEYDKERGIYDYEIEPDGRAVKLKLKKQGSGLIYMESGKEDDEKEIVVIVVN